MIIELNINPTEIVHFLSQQPYAIVYPLAAISVLDVLMGVLVALKNKTFDVNKLPQFVETTVAWQVWAAIVVAVCLEYVSQGQSGALVALATLVGVNGAAFVKVANDVRAKLVEFVVGKRGAPALPNPPAVA